MPVHRPHHRVVRTIPVLWIALLAAICCAAASAAVSSSQAPALKGRRPTLAGTWSGSYQGAFSGTFTLHWTRSGSHLSGTISLSNPSWEIRHQRQRARQRAHIRSRRSGRDLHGHRVGQVHVGQVQDTERRRQLERAQDLLMNRASSA